ncbi:hypothetical protein LTS18_000557 [Coniosporium uncinatum]|uniref:Uncharacterized protein n=1 Tax=Coniosporium uncinatum TaxID=93489 RepID=A0ACC3DUR5_9PEZI|nr:hypothetical protein LTS18_000557 [Coniosporium uncinatum]
MHFTSLITSATLCLAGLQGAFAAPFEERSFIYNVLATFDDLTNPTPLTSTTEINQYKKLDYSGFVLGTLGAAGITAAGIVPQSSPNVALFAANTMVLYGTPTLSTSGTSSKAFDLNSFYFGCVVASEETAASLPAACTINIKGYNLSGKQVQSQSFSFQPNGLVQSQMVKAKVNNWKALSRVEFAIQGTVASTTLAALFDNFNYVVAG